MRRNAESLLVLAGIDSGRRLRDAMPLSDVIRTASSEIEQYDRVELDLQVDPHMLGFNALGAAHLLAELLENATIFSEPETPVVVTTGIVGDKVVVRILDHGLGMTDSEIEAANYKIASTSASDALGAQRLGLFVVGRIAGRLGAQVELRKSSRGTGTETFVRFPSTLFSLTEAPSTAPVRRRACRPRPWPRRPPPSPSTWPR
ncbi:sensor histidine kinase [Cellulomonas soli]